MRLATRDLAILVTLYMSVCVMPVSDLKIFTGLSHYLQFTFRSYVSHS